MINMITKINFRHFILICLTLLYGLTVSGQKGDDYNPATNTYFIQNATIIPMPGKSLEKQNILIEKGIIKDIGSHLKKPGHAKIIKGDSLYIYAGFIDAFSNTGIPAPQQGRGQGSRGGQGQSEGPQPKRYDPTNKQAGITPEVSISESLKTNDKSIQSWREQGFTTSHSVPRGNFLPGKGSIILLKNADKIEDLILWSDCSIYSNLRGSRPVYPSTVIAVMSKWRELYTNAALAKKHQSRWEKNPVGIVRPSVDPATEALYELIEGKVPLFAEANNASNVSKVIRLQKELEYPMVIAGLKDQGFSIDILKGTNYPLVLSLDMPKKPEELKKAEKKDKAEKGEKKEKGDKKEKMKKEEKESAPSIYTEAEKERLEQSKIKAFTATTSFPAKLNQQGHSFSFGTKGTKAKDFKGNLTIMIEQGLDKDQALAALTTEPAKLLGLEKIMGTVEKGKIANLMITNKPYFEEDAQIKYMIVDGQKFEYELKEKKKKGKKDKEADDDMENANPHGTWSYTIFIPTGDERSGMLSFTKTDEDIIGKMSSSESPGDYSDLSKVELNGNNLSFDFEFEMQGNAMIARIHLAIDEDEMEGTFKLDAFGSMPMSAVKESDNPE